MTALRVFSLLQLSLYYDRHGHPRLSETIRMHAPLETFQRGVGKILGVHTQLVYTHLGGAALDVDHNENLAAMEMMYDNWMAHQQSLRETDVNEPFFCRAESDCISANRFPSP